MALPNFNKLSDTQATFDKAFSMIESKPGISILTMVFSKQEIWSRLDPLVQVELITKVVLEEILEITNNASTDS